MDTDTILITSLFGFALIMCIAAIIGSRHHVLKAKLKYKFKTLSDGSIQMEFPGFGGVQTKRTARFHEEYKIGMEIVHEGKKYKIVNFKEVADHSALRNNIKIVVYLQEHL